MYPILAQFFYILKIDIYIFDQEIHLVKTLGVFEP